MGSSAALKQIELQPGLTYVPGYLDRAQQKALLADLRKILEDAPLYQALMPRSGKPLSVRMSNCGPLGWYTDQAKGYRYEAVHPLTGRPWPAMPDLALQAWEDLAGTKAPAQACLINYYDAAAKMGLHQDRDERALATAVVSLSLGDACLYRFGGATRQGPTKTIKLESGDALVLGGGSRMAFHGVDKIFTGSSTLLPEGGRFNLTLRRVDAFTPSS